jgi:hypothetical protein
MLDLAETDAYYVGLARSVLRGVEKAADAAPLTDLKKRFAHVLADRIDRDDALVVVEAQRYLQSLNELAGCLITRG